MFQSQQLLPYLKYVIPFALAFIVLKFVIVSIYRVTWHPLAKYPGPWTAKFTDWYGAYHSARGQLHIKTWQGHQKWGSIVRQGPNKVVLNSVEGLQDVYHSKNVQKSKGYLSMVPSPGVYNIHTAVDKSLHKHKRKVIGQGLSDQCMRAFEPTMLDKIDIFVKKLATASTDNQSEGNWSIPVNMTQSCKHLGYDVMGEYGFGQSFEMQSKPDNHFLLDAVEATSHRSGVYGQYPGLAKYKLEKLLYPKSAWMRERYLSLMTDLVEWRLKEARDSKNDLFSFIIDAKDEETGRGFTHKELWSESRFLLVAGADTSSTALSAAFFYLSMNPVCYDKLASEVRNTFSSASEIRTGPKLASCHYLRACIDEALRMSPPAGGTLWREVCEGGVVVDDAYIPAGCDVGCSVYAVHHNEKYFPDSYKYKPERWIAEDTPKEIIELARLAFNPFSLGPRGCAGKTMAYMELCNTLGRAIWYMDFRRADGPLGLVGAGSSDDKNGRNRVDEFQLQDHLTSSHDGPYIQFSVRKGFEKGLESVSIN
ncbi:hypothetical protein G7Y89_g1665 [Cudoniella acicularis]|uniref:Cytochrome P450 n=1 Tax=Cudoniella acicularis TaxID=354080 RepID=A0A8H4RVX4_9HELO|nr:hypothetical protein G7Y89_g1665 [Cudoniella acicularis]